MKYNIGADVGGTFIKCGVADEKGNIISSLKVPTPDGAAVPQAIAAASREAVRTAGMTMEEISSIGIGTTGICDFERGAVIKGANIPHYENIDVCNYVTQKLKKPSYIDNDANCAALGEYIVSGDKADNFVFVTLGTGIGGGIIIGGRLLRGVNGTAGEIGHITFLPGGEKCSCGRSGCWERYASVSALVRQSAAAGFKGRVTGRTAFEAARRGDERGKRVLETWLNYVAAGICDIVNIFQPDKIVIGGGVSREGDAILLPVQRYVAQNSMTGRTEKLKQTKIEVSRLFNDAGLIGAAFLHTQK